MHYYYKPTPCSNTIFYFLFFECLVVLRYANQSRNGPVVWKALRSDSNVPSESGIPKRRDEESAPEAAMADISPELAASPETRPADRAPGPDVGGKAAKWCGNGMCIPLPASGWPHAGGISKGGCCRGGGRGMFGIPAPWCSSMTGLCCDGPKFIGGGAIASCAFESNLPFSAKAIDSEYHVHRWTCTDL